MCIALTCSIRLQCLRLPIRRCPNRWSLWYESLYRRHCRDRADLIVRKLLLPNIKGLPDGLYRIYVILNLPWRHDWKVFEGWLSPSQKLKSLFVSFKLFLFVFGEWICGSSRVNLDGVIDDQVDGAVRVDFWRISSQPCNSVSHGCQIDNERHSCEILEDDSGWFEGDLCLNWGYGTAVLEVSFQFMIFSTSFSVTL